MRAFFACLLNPTVLCPLAPLQAAFPQYQYPTAKQDYADLATMLNLGGNTVDEKVVKLIEAVENLKKQCDVPATIKEIFNDASRENEFLDRIEL